MKVVRSALRRDRQREDAARRGVMRFARFALYGGAACVVGVLLLALIAPGVLQRGLATVESRWSGSIARYDQPLADKLSIMAGDFLRIAGDEAVEIPELTIDIPFKGMQKIYEKRERALVLGKLVQGEDDFVKAEIRVAGRTVPVKLRLKGDFNDHLAGRKWSFRIHTRQGDHVFGMRRFSIQSPVTRGYQSEILFFEAAKQFGVLTPRYFFIDVTLNGESMGVMALEESFSKELLEFNRRREGVIVRFDESMVWASTDSPWGRETGWEGAFDDYRNAVVDGFGSGKIAESPTLSKQYRVAVGLLRGFVAGELPASDVFDVEQMGRLLAVADAFGSWHSVAWHNQRFYLNPVTLRLEPIAYDVTLQRRFKQNESVLNDDPFIMRLVDDPAVFRVYQSALNELAETFESGQLFAELNERDQQELKILRTEFRLLPNYPLEYVGERISELQSRYGTSERMPSDQQYLEASVERGFYPMLARLRLLEGSDSSTLEITNVIPKAAEVVSLQWVEASTGRSVQLEAPQLPLRMPARGVGSAAQHWFIDVGSIPGVPGEWSLQGTVRLAGRQWDQTETAYISYAPLKERPIPEASLEELLEQHAFVEPAEGKNALRIGPGAHTVESSLFVPRGYALRIEPGAKLRFATDAVMTVNGPLQVAGTEAEPVMFEGIDGGRWPGIIVMHAGERSTVDHWQVRDTSSIITSQWTLTGGINFYASDVEIRASRFLDSHGEDALNIIQSDFLIDGLTIDGTASDAFDSDFSVGTVTNSRFLNVGKAGGGDAVDVSGSQIVVTASEFRDVSDKALSVGEKSEMEASGIDMQNVGTGAASKDGSVLRLSDSKIDGASFAGFSAYIKKPEYGPARIEAANVAISNTETPALAQTGSAVIVDGVELETRDVDVDALYETIMRKGLK